MRIKFHKAKPWVMACYGFGALCILAAFLAHYLDWPILSTIGLQRLFIVGGIVVCIASGANTYYTIRGRHKG